MRILVVQLARLGDILQTLPMVAGLKARHPGCTVDLVVREKFAEAALISPHVDRVISLPSKAILGPLVENPKADKNVKAVCLAQLITWVADEFLERTHHDGPYDLTLNCTFSESSSYLTALIPSKERRGLTRAKDGAYAVTDAWGAYIYSQVLRKNMNILHLNDLFARMAGVAAMNAEPLTRGYDASSDFGPLAIGMQMGASQTNKTLNPKAWGELAACLLKALPEAHLVLFGGKEDKKRAQAVMNALGKELKSRCTSLVGRMRYSEIVPWVKRMHHMITPDTAMVHLAPLCGVKTINISVGDVNPHETGPYGAGHFVLRPLDTTFEAGMEPLAESVIGIIMGEGPGKDVPALATRLIPCSDGTVRSALEPMNFKPDELEHLLQQAYYLLAEFRCAGRQEDLPIPVIGSPDQASRLDALKTTIEAFETTRRLAEFGRQYCVKMMENPKNREILSELGNKIGEIEGLYRNLHAAVPTARPLLDLWEVQKENVIGDGIEELASLTEGTFRELIQNVDMVHELIQLALDAAEKRYKEATPAKTAGINKEPGQEAPV